MIVMCVFWSAFLTWLTKRTNSVYPAALCHMLIDTILNTNLMPFAYNANGDKFELRTNDFWGQIISVFPMIIIAGAVSMVLMWRKKSSGENKKVLS